jgi:hypothetical protein
MGKTWGFGVDGAAAEFDAGADGVGAISVEFEDADIAFLATEGGVADEEDFGEAFELDGAVDGEIGAGAIREFVGESDIDGAGAVLDGGTGPTTRPLRVSMEAGLGAEAVDLGLFDGELRGDGVFGEGEALLLDGVAGGGLLGGDLGALAVEGGDKAVFEELVVDPGRGARRFGNRPWRWRRRTRLGSRRSGG